MDSNAIRNAFLDFYRAREHAVIPSASLVPQNDPTTLFTGSGMQPLVPYLLGKEHPEGNRLVNSQKSFRSGDIEEVGDNRHTTFFEMLGNWSLGDYFKAEQLPWIFEFLTGVLELDPQKLYVTVYSGSEDGTIPKDTESIAIWQKLFSDKGITAEVADMITEEGGYERGMKEGERVFAYRDKNWWSRVGAPENMPPGEPGGPDSEIFYDFGSTSSPQAVQHDTKFGEHCHPNCDCGRFLEIGNSVFMQYIKKEDGSFSKLPKQNVDFGGGLERLAMAVNDNPDIIAVNHRPILTYLENAAGIKYGANEKETRAFRIIADHMKAAVFLIQDGIRPSNTDQGYFVRRLLRRSVRYADSLGIGGGFEKIVQPIVEMYTESYPELTEKTTEIASIVAEEEQRFRTTLTRGMSKFEEHVRAIVVPANASSETKEAALENAQKELHADKVFELITTDGFPSELVREIATERDIYIDWNNVDELMKRHRELSRAGSEQKFKGGLADASEATTRLHTTHHLLLKALQIVLGDHVHQRGSNITAERLRIDFNHEAKMTDEQKAEVERIVNEQIDAALPVVHSTLPKEAAEKLGAEHEFGAKYPDMVSVYSVGPAGATEEDPRFEEAFSIEFCGGPHVGNTSEIAESGRFRIAKEEASSAGVRRIKGILD